MLASLIDELTKCYNRRYLKVWFEREISRAKRFNCPFSIILIDLDNFREINNNFGHLEGDLVLQEFAKFLRENIRKIDQIVRYGGDEFLILIPGANEKNAYEIASRILLKLNDTKIHGHTITACMGIATYPDCGETLNELLMHADSCMYYAKKEGKNRVGKIKETQPKLLIPSPEFIGRNRELSEIIQELHDGRRCILLKGVMGIGKTRLALEVFNSFKGSTLIQANAYLTTTAIPYFPFKNLLSYLRENNPELLTRALEALPPALKAEIEKFMPQGRISPAEHTDGSEKYKLFEAVRTFLDCIGELVYPGNLFLLFDNIVWAGKETFELIDYLMRTLRKESKFIFTCRLEDLESSFLSKFLHIWARERFVKIVELTPLTKNETQRLIESILGTVPEGLLDAVYTKSGGNPFFIEEILKQMEKERVIYVYGETWHFDPEKSLSIPETLEEAVQFKIENVPDEAREVLKILSTFGRCCSPREIAEVLKLNEGFVLDALDKLIRQGVVKETEPDRYYFTAQILQEIVLRKIPRGEQFNLHLSVAQAIEKLYRDNLHDHLEELAYHYAKCRFEEKALDYAKRAAKKVKELYAYEKAIEFLRIALNYEKSPPARAELYLELAEIHYLSGDYESAQKAIEECLKISSRLPEAYKRLGDICREQGLFSEALKNYRKALKYLQKGELYYRTKLEIAWAYCRMGNYKDAEKLCSEALRNRRLNKNDRGFAYNILGAVYLFQGDVDRALYTYKKALKIKKEINDKRGMGASYLNLGLVHQVLTQFEKAEKFYKLAVQNWKEIGYQLGLVIAYLDLGSLYMRLNYQEAEKWLLKALDIAKVIGANEYMVHIYFNLGEIYFYQLRKNEALDFFNLACEFSKEIGFEKGLAWGYLGLGKIYSYEENYERAESYITEAERILEKNKRDSWYLYCLGQKTELLLALGRIDEADKLSQTIVKIARNENRPECKMHAYNLRGLVLNEFNRLEEGRQFLEKALEIAESKRDIQNAGISLFHLGLNYLKEKKFQKANNYMSRARKYFEKLGNYLYLEEIEKSKENALLKNCGTRKL